MNEDKKTLRLLYAYICKSEKIRKVKLVFCKVGRGGACCSYMRGTKKVTDIRIDLQAICCGAAYALCHEVAHQILIQENGNATHNREFKKLEKKLVATYANCEIARKLIF